MSPGRKLAVDPISEAARKWDEQGWTEASAGMSVITSVMRVQQVLIARVDEVLRPVGLTLARFEVLMLLMFSRTGALPMGKIGERLQVHPASVTNAMDRLVSQGLVERHPHPTDGRRMLAQLTPAGRELATRAAAELNVVVFAKLELNAGEMTEAFELLRKLRFAAGDFE